jgi:uncharacterized HAD superfamily protein/orotate phosphoribosyltransferase
MFGYVSLADLSNIVRSGLQKLPEGIDLIVGIPRSGMIPAYMIGLYLNRHVVDLETFLRGAQPASGTTRRVGVALDNTMDASRILLVDDSITSGKAMRNAFERIRDAGFKGETLRCVAICDSSARSLVDIYFAEIPIPRIFEWNALHHSYLETSCFDLDGIFCIDPTPEQNDDGPRYIEFLKSAQPLHRPSRRIGHIVSARLEKYRGYTEEWLHRAGIEYNQLHLLNLESQAERIRLGAHKTHKAAVYKETGAMLFYESDIQQAKDIARLSSKPVLCVQDMKMYLPGIADPAANIKRLKWMLRKPLGRLKDRFRTLRRA